MTNRFIKLQMINYKSGGGAFVAKANFTLPIYNKKYTFKRVNVKIDTGCTISVISLRKFVSSESFEEMRQLKSLDIINNVENVRSYGVESEGMNHDIPKTFEEKMKCTALKFRHTMKDFNIAGLSLGDTDIFVNYDRTSNILIGMDILKTWDIHIGRVKSGETILLACPYNQLNDEYLSELEEMFRLGALLYSAELRDSIDFD